MMASLRILVPDGTTNYIENPAFRYATTGWTAVGSTLTRVLTQARFNIASMQIVAAGSALYEGAYYRVSRLSGISEPVTASIYARGTGTVRIRLHDGGVSGREYTSQAVQLRSTRWTRLTVTGHSTGSDDMRLYIETTDKVQGVTFYVDGAQMERHPYPTTYADGDQPGCWWNVMSHNSQSTRDPYTRQGGRWVDLAGCERTDPNLYFTVAGGMGAAMIRNNTQSFGDSPGSYYQNTKVLDRVVTLTFHAKAPDFRREESSRKNLHRLRQTLFDLIKPDKTRGGEEFLLEYQDGDRALYFGARYDGGLEGEWDIRQHWVDSFPLRLLAVSPFMTEDDREAATLTFRERSTVNYAMQRFDGAWSEMNGGFNARVQDFAIGSQGEIVAVGLFNKANNKTTAIDPQIFANFVCYWDGRKWVAYGSGANGIINAVAIAPNGDVIVTGEFTNIGGVAANRIARYVKSTGLWTALGTGLTGGAGYDVAVSPNGDIYVVGAFTTAGGILVHYCARYDTGGGWHSMGFDPGLNNFANAVVISPDGAYVYIGGDFTDEWNTFGNIVAQHVVLYEVSTNLFFGLGNGFNDSVYDLVYAPSGRVYACGAFTESSSTAQILLYVAYWNGSQWFEMGGGADGTVRVLDVTPLGEVIAGGDFARIGSVDSPYLALWNQTAWVNLDVEMSAAVYAAIFDRKGNIYTGAGVLSDYASRTTVENVGSAQVNPEIYILGPATLKWIENQTTKVRVYADLDILQNEEVTIKFSEGRIDSTVRGDLSYALLPGSDMRNFQILPGNNVIAAFMTDDTAAKMQLYYEPRHWGADATEEGEEW